MDQKMVVLEGKVFTIELQSMLASTGYGWCLSKLPEGIILEGEERVPVGPGVAPVMQKFYFGVSSAKETEAEITFVMACTFQPTRIEREYKVSLTIIPSNSEEFVSYSENANALYAYAFNQTDACSAMNCAQPYGVRSSWERSQVQKPYGFPGPDYEVSGKNSDLGAAPDALMKYGYYCAPDNTVMKYGYPCGAQDAVMKYGYPCGMQDAVMKYGYPCGMQDTVMKYGYPCGMQDAVMKYGYPCGMQAAAAKNEPFITKYGYVCR